MKRLLVVGLLALNGVASAQQSTIRAFLRLNAAGQLRTPGGKAILGEEATDWPPRFGPLAKEPDTVAHVSSDFATARVQGLSAVGKPVVDLYFYLRRQRGRWRVVAYRTLALTDVIHAVRDGLREKKDLSPEERRALLNADLTLSSDRDLRVFYLNHRVLLERLAFATKGYIPTPSFQRELDDAGFATASRDASSVRLTIGGVTDNSVGFLKVLRGKPPTISPSDTIWLEPLGGGWYLFKTT